MDTTALLSNTALLQALQDTPEYKALVLKQVEMAQAALKSKTFTLSAYGDREFTLPQIAIKAITRASQWHFPSEQAFKDSEEYQTAAEALAIIKAQGYKADAASLKELIALGF